MSAGLDLAAVNQMFTDIYGASIREIPPTEFGINEFDYLISAIEVSATPENETAVFQVTDSMRTLLHENTSDAIRFRREVGEDVEGFLDRLDTFLTENPDPSTLDVHGFVSSGENLDFDDAQIEEDMALAEEIIESAEADGVEVSAGDLQSEMAFQNDMPTWEGLEADVEPGTLDEDGNLELGTIETPEPEEFVGEPAEGPEAIDLSETADISVLHNGVAGDDIPYLQDLIRDAREMGVDVSAIDALEAQLDGNVEQFVTEEHASIATAAYGEEFQAALADGVLDSSEYQSMLSNYFTNLSGGIVENTAGFDDVAASAEQKADAAVALEEVMSTAFSNAAAGVTPVPALSLDPNAILDLDPEQLETMLDEMDPTRLANFQTNLRNSPQFREALSERLESGDLSNGSQNLIDAQQLMTAAGLYNRGIDGLNGSGTQAGITQFESLPALASAAPRLATVM